MSEQTAFDKNIFDAYENGKHRRYALLFSVNGGAFAVAKFLIEASEKLPASILGWQLAIGLAFFTAVMVWDIFEFGWKMKGYAHSKRMSLFEWKGQVVLGLLALLILAGWALVPCQPCF